MTNLISINRYVTLVLAQLTVVVAGCLLALPAVADVKILDYALVVVNDDIILRSEFSKQYQEVVDSLKGRKIDRKALKTQVLDRMILHSLQLQVAKRRGIEISEEELSNAMRLTAERNGYQSMAKFRDALRDDGLDFDAVREQIREQIIISRVSEQAVKGQVRVTEQEITSFLNSQEGQEISSPEYLFNHYRLDWSSMASEKQKARIKKAANAIAEAWRKDKNSQELMEVASKYRVKPEFNNLNWRHQNKLPSLLIQYLPNLTDGEVLEPIITDNAAHIFKLLAARIPNSMVQEVQVRHILTRPSVLRSEEETEELMDDIYTQLKNGADFAELAGLYSVDHVSVAGGGSIGWVTTDSVDKDFAQVMNDTEIDGISRPFRTNFGWHVLQVTDRRTRDLSDDVVQNRARTVLYRRKFSEEMTNWLRKIRDEAYVEVKSDG